MKRLTLWLMGIVVGLLSRPLVAVEVPADAPRGALGVLVCRDFDSLEETWQRLSKLFGAEEKSSLSESFHIEPALLPWIDFKRSFVTLIYSKPAFPIATTVTVDMIPVKDYAEFLKAAGEVTPVTATISKVHFQGKEVWVAKRGDYFLSVEKAEEQPILEQALAAPGGLGEEVQKLREWSARQDVAVLITQAGVDYYLAQLATGIGTTIPVIFPQAELADKFNEMNDSVRGGGSEIAACGLGARLDAGLSLTGSAEVLLHESGALAHLAADIHPSDCNFLSMFPNRPLVFAGGGPYLNTGSQMDFVRFCMHVSPEFKALSAEVQEKLLENMERSPQFQSVGMMLALPDKGESMFEQVFAVYQVQDPKAALQLMKEIQETSQKLLAETNYPSKIKSVQSFQFDQYEGLEIEQEFNVPPGNPNTRQMEQMFRFMFGEDGFHMSLLAFDPENLLAVFGKKERLQAMLAASESSTDSLLGSQIVAQTTGLLPGDAQWTGYFDLGNMMQLVGRISETMQQPREMRTFFENLKVPAAPPVGFSLRVSTKEIESQVVVPEQTILSWIEFFHLTKEQMMP